jgi:outer membrane protein TolC
LLPKLDLFIDLGKTGYAESFSDAFKNLDDNNYELAAGVRFSTYLGNREDQARDLAARASLEQSEAALENLRNLIQMDVRIALNETERTRQQIEAGKVTRALQEQTLQAEQERFSIGASTSLLVAQAQRDLLLSQLVEIESIVDYRISLVNLYLAEGSLLERRGIQIQAAPRVSYFFSIRKLDNTLSAFYI